MILWSKIGALTISLSLIITNSVNSVFGREMKGGLAWRKGLGLDNGASLCPDVVNQFISLLLGANSSVTGTTILPSHFLLSPLLCVRNSYGHSLSLTHENITHFFFLSFYLFLDFKIIISRTKFDSQCTKFDSQ